MVTKYQTLFLVAVTVFIFAYFKEYGEISSSEISTKLENVESRTIKSDMIVTTEKDKISTAAVETKQENKEVCFFIVYFYLKNKYY